MYSKPVKITSLEYFRDQNRDSRRELGYYNETDNETGSREADSYGTWFVPENMRSLPPISSMIVHGENIAWDVIDPYSRAIDPETETAYFERTSKKIYIAEDVTNSAPKEVSIVNGLAKAKVDALPDGEEKEFWKAVSEACQSSHDDANNYSLNWGVEQGAWQVRSGHNGTERDTPDWLAIAQYRHFTSRAGDMQLHTHNVIPNVGRKPDGSFGALDNHRFTLLRGSMSALYRAQLFANLKERLGALGIEVSTSLDGRNVKLNGVDDELVAHFSKRRQDIMKWMRENGYAGTAGHREAAQIAAYDTRGAKEDLPPQEELYRQWLFNADVLGYTPEAILEKITETSRIIEREKAELWEKEKAQAAEEGRELPAERPEVEIEAVKELAVKRILEFESVFEESDFRTAMLEQLQVYVDGDTALKVFEEVAAERRLVQIGTSGRSKEAVYSTEAMLKLEGEMFATAKAMQNNIPAFDMRLVSELADAPIMKDDGSGESFTLYPEQKEFLKHLYSSSSMTICVGDAGTGKTTIMRKAKEYNDQSGLNTYIVGPTHRSVDVLRKETGVDGDKAFAVAGIIAAFDKGKLSLSSKDFIIVDEAGMIGTREWHKLQQIAMQTGANIRFVGDYKQLPPVAAGAPMRALCHWEGVIPTARLKNINRQKEGWMLVASKALASSDPATALRAYDDHGCLTIADDAKDTVGKAVQKYFERFDANPMASITVTNKTNAGVRRIAQAIHEEKIARGIVHGENVTFTAIQRGKEGRRTDVHLMAGVRIITGETIKFQGERIANNSFATVKEVIDNGKGQEPTITATFDDGRTFTFKPSEFVGFREEDDPLRKLPKIALSDAMTYYAVQGMTSDYHIDVITEAPTLEDTYIGETRHKYGLDIVADGERLHNEVAVKEGKTLTLSKESGATSQKDDTLDATVTREQMVEQLIKEAKRGAGKRNACDLLGGPQKYLERFEAGTLLEYREEKKLTNEVEPKKANVGKPMNGRNPFGVRGVGRIGGDVSEERKPEPEMKPKTESEKLAEAMEKTANSDHRETVPPSLQKAVQKAKVAKENPRDKYVNKGGKITPEELAQFTRINLVEYMIEKGASYNDRVKQGAGGEYKITDPDLGKLIVTQFRSGNWGFMSYDGEGHKGHIGDYVAVKERVTRIVALHSLRAEFGTAPAEVSNARFKQKLPAEETLRGKIERVLSQPITEGKYWIAKNWADAKEGMAAYLLNRGISADTLRRFRADMRLEGRHSRDGKNDGGVMFAMRSRDGELRGYTRKGTQIDVRTGNPMASAAGGSAKYPVMMGDRNQPSRIYAGESIIDCMSLHQKDGSPDKSLLLATSGNVGEKEAADIFHYAKENPKAEWHYCVQNDAPDAKTGIKANDVHLKDVRDAVMEANPQAQFIERKPPENVKDWNDVVKAEYQAAKAQSQPQEPRQSNRRDQEAEIRATRARQQEEARRRAEEQKQKDGPTR